ncbi:MAG TPA: competence protein CoiA family protein [Candidatus Avamphibacillus sp.]|nr:competence protein CoiA family protein [Candidatus Avamphibacillus sp.]
MLQAKFKNGQLFTLIGLPKHRIEQLRKKHFYCPTCNEKVIIRAGPQTIPHFFHYQKSECPSVEGGEGAYHEKGKLLLYHWLKKQHTNVFLEKHLPQINQRPDLLLLTKNKKIAIEYQCVRIPIKLLLKRNKGYQQLGIKPIWILGANQMKRMGQNSLKLDPFTLRFIHQFQPQYSTFLYYFCPDTNQFLIASDLYVTSQRRAAAKLRFLKLDKIYFNDLFYNHQFEPKELIRFWRSAKQQFRYKRRKKPRGRELAWYQWLYLKQVPIEYLPSEIYLPVSNQFLMKTSLWDWQSRICLDIIEPLDLGDVFTLDECFYLLQNHTHRKENFPLLNAFIHPIQQYLITLVQLQIIQQVSPTHYKKISPLHFFKNIEEAMKEDVQLMIKLNSKILNKI